MTTHRNSKGFLFGMLSLIMGWLLIGLCCASAQAVPIDPASLSGRILHHRADALLGIGNSLPGDGASVSVWNDVSASASHATNSGSGAFAGTQPVFKTNQINGLPVVRFDGINDVLLQALDTPTGAKTVFLVYKSDGLVGGSDFDDLFSLKDVGPNTWTRALLTTNGSYQPTGFLADFLVASAVGVGPALDTNFHTLGFTYNGGAISSTGSYGARYNGAPEAVVANSTFGLSATDQGAIGANVSSTNSIFTPFDGDLAEMIVYNRQLTATEFAGVDEFLFNKYFVEPVILPVPEPATLWLAAPALLLVLRRRSRTLHAMP